MIIMYCYIFDQMSFFVNLCKCNPKWIGKAMCKVLQCFMCNVTVFIFTMHCVKVSHHNEKLNLQIQSCAHSFGLATWNKVKYHLNRPNFEDLLFFMFDVSNYFQKRKPCLVMLLCYICFLNEIIEFNCFLITFYKKRFFWLLITS